MTVCTHPSRISLNDTRCSGYTHCPDCGYETEPAGHLWVPAGLEPDDPKACARCNAEQATPQG